MLTDHQIKRMRDDATRLPLYGIPDWSGIRLAGQWGWENETLSYAGLIFGDPAGTKPWIEVTTTNIAAEELRVSVSSGVAFETESPRDEETYRRLVDAASSAPPEIMSIDLNGVHKPFRYWPDEPFGRERGRGWRAVLDGTPGLLIQASGMSAADVRLIRIVDIEPHLAGSREYALAGYDTA